MFTTEELKHIIYQDEKQLIENPNWADHFYELILERYNALDALKSPGYVLKLDKDLLLQLVRSRDFDEMHLFKVYDNANVFSLLKDLKNGLWDYEFIIVYKGDTQTIHEGIETISDLKQRFKNKKPLLEIPLPPHRKYKDD